KFAKARARPRRNTRCHTVMPEVRIMRSAVWSMVVLGLIAAPGCASSGEPDTDSGSGAISSAAAGPARLDANAVMAIDASAVYARKAAADDKSIDVLRFDHASTTSTKLTTVPVVDSTDVSGFTSDDANLYFINGGKVLRVAKTGGAAVDLASPCP